jgi:hypothetical protein
MIARLTPMLFVAACATALPNHRCTSSPPSHAVQVVASANLDSLLAAVRREYPVPALAAAAVRENTLSSALSVNAGWGALTPFGPAIGFILARLRSR